MIKRILSLVISFPVAMILYFATPAYVLGEDIEGDVRVFGGGVVWVRGHWLHLSGISGPYDHDLCDSSENIHWQCGLAAMSWLADFTSGKRFSCASEYFEGDRRRWATCFEVDRESGNVLPDTPSLNRLWIQSGWAVAASWASDEFKNDEAIARQSSLGMWSIGTPLWKVLGHNSERVALPSNNLLVGVAKVINGNTVEINGTRLRLYGSDAPDLTQRCRFTGAIFECGFYAKSHLANVIKGKKVVCEYKTYLVDTLYASCRGEGDGVTLAAKMVTDGWAVADRPMTDALVDLELEARREKRGLWLSTFALPAQWRFGKRQ